MDQPAGMADVRIDLRGMNPLEQAYAAQARGVPVHCADAKGQRNCRLTLLALAGGSFCIGTTEFASMGIIQLFAADLRISIPRATDAVTAYAFGVVIGAPLVTLAAARLNRRILLLGLMVLFIIGNLLSATATSIQSLVVARFVSGLPQGAYFGAGAVVASYIVGPGRSGKAFAIVMTGLTIATIFGSPLATWLGQTVGWRATYGAVAAAGAIALAMLALWIPRTAELDGSPVTQELRSLRKAGVWGVMAVAAVGVGSIFAVYTFIGPIVTDVDKRAENVIPVALALFGVGMTVGNLVGGKLADAYPARGIAIGFASAAIVLIILAVFGAHLWIMLAAMFGVGATMMTAIPTIQVRLTRLAPEAPSLMGAMNLASLNVANAIGAWAGGVAIAMGAGFLSAVWAGLVLTLSGLAIFGLTLLKPARPSPLVARHRRG